MNYRPYYIVVLVGILLIAMSGVVLAFRYGEYQMDSTPTPTSTPTPNFTPTPTPTPTSSPTPTPTPTPVPTPTPLPDELSVETSTIDNPTEYLPPDVNYAQLPDAAAVYPTLDDVQAESPFTRHGGNEKIWVNAHETSVVEGTEYRRITWDDNLSGWIKNEALNFSPYLSRLRGVNIRERDDEHLAMVYVETLNVRSSPGGEEGRVGQIHKYDFVSVQEQATVGDVTWYRIGKNQWIHSEYVRSLIPGPRPEGVDPNDKWIEVNIAEQIVVAHEGDTPVFATLTSTGRPGNETIRGLFRPWLKLKTTPMRGARFGLGYDLADIPWTYYFQGSYAWHGTYWHDDYGTKQSAGCVNLSPFDAHWIFEWSKPDLPENQHEIRPAQSQPGTWVYVH